ncbi:MAG: hypothetical protein ABFS17_13860 [Chloroflexota bacterium]
MFRALPGLQNHNRAYSYNDGHGGGDYGVVRSFVAAQPGEADALTNAPESMES